MDKTEQELAARLGFRVDELGCVWCGGGEVGADWPSQLKLWNLAKSLLQENAKLSESVQWHQTANKVMAEGLAEKDARIKELKAALARVLQQDEGRNWLAGHEDAQKLLAKGGSQ